MSAPGSVSSSSHMSHSTFSTGTPLLPKRNFECSQRPCRQSQRKWPPLDPGVEDAEMETD